VAIIVLLGVTVLPLVVSSVVMVRQWQAPRPRAFVVREGMAFVIPANRAYGDWVVFLLVGFAVGVSRATERWFSTPDPEPPVAAIQYETASFATVLALLFGVFAAAAATQVLRGTPRVELTSRAVVVRYLTGTRTIAWEALRPGLPTHLNSRYLLTLTVDRPHLVARRGLTPTNAVNPPVQLEFARVDPWFLAGAIRYYADRPHRRGAIGTSVEYERLLGVLAGAPMSPPPVQAPHR